MYEYIKSLSIIDENIKFMFPLFSNLKLNNLNLVYKACLYFLFLLKNYLSVDTYNVDMNFNSL